MIEAAIDQIERHGVGALTVRAVAAAAEVNIAAVSYHFGSKDALIAAALDGSIRHMVADSMQYLDRVADEPAALTELFLYYLEGALRYPRLTKAHLYAPLVADDYEGPFVTHMAPVVERLRGTLQAAVPGLGKREAGRRAIAALSGVFLPAFFGGLFAPLGSLDRTSDRARYAGELARAALLPIGG
jgi:TetR/AcrR family transcriptional regulator, regulator of cefoperazone and chloramphenicol sensitivity